MDWSEHLMLIAWASRNFGDKMKIVGNTGSNSTREAVHATEQGFAVSARVAACRKGRLQSRITELLVATRSNPIMCPLD